jgi:hypothetical protein
VSLCIYCRCPIHAVLPCCRFPHLLIACHMHTVASTCTFVATCRPAHHRRNDLLRAQGDWAGSHKAGKAACRVEPGSPALNHSHIELGGRRRGWASCCLGAPPCAQHSRVGGAHATPFQYLVTAVKGGSSYISSGGKHDGLAKLLPCFRCVRCCHRIAAQRMSTPPARSAPAAHIRSALHTAPRC